MSNTAADNPPTPRCCRRILEAHHLDCQGLSLQQIGDRLGCARSTAHAYLRDFRIHRTHILHTVAADRLASQVYRPTQHQTDPAQHRQLRFLLLNPPDLYANHSDDLDQPGLTKPEPDQPSQDPGESGPIQTNLDKSEHQSDEFSVPDRE